jgi:hypothetical protein
MTGKKIQFSQKPIVKPHDHFIDEWVSGTINQQKNDKLKRTTIFLPEKLHKQLKVEAANREISMTEIIIEAVKKYI